MHVASDTHSDLVQCDLATLDGRLHTVLQHIADENGSQDSRIRHSDSVRRILSQGRTDHLIGSAALRRVSTKCFDIIEKHLANISRTLGPCTSSHSPGALRRRAVYQDLSNLGAYVLHSLFEQSAPKYPLERPGRISSFLVSALRINPESDTVWNLLRRALTMDCFNVIQCTFDYSTSRDIARGATCQSGATEPLKKKDADTSDDLCVLAGPKQKNESNVLHMTYNSLLWSELNREQHIPENPSAKSTALEIQSFLQIHRIIGSITPERLKILHTPDRMEKVQVATPSIKSDSSSYICDSIKSMQTVTFRCLGRALSKGMSSEWVVEPSFHAMHLLCTQSESLYSHVLECLLSRFNASSATVSGRRSKTALISIKKDPAQATSFALGFHAASQVITSWGNVVVPASVYVKYFQWCRSVLEVKLLNELLSAGAAEWILGVIFGFLRCWKRFEEEEPANQFQEVCCRFFAILREIWHDLYADDGKVYETSQVNHRQIKKWISNVQNDLLDMHALKNIVVRTAWVQTVIKLAPSWSCATAYCEKLTAVISEQSANRGPLGIDQCENLAKTAGISEELSELAKWRKHTDKQKRLDDAVQACKLKNKKTAMRCTKIEDHFKPKVSSAPSAKAKNAPSSTPVSSFFKAAGTFTAPKFALSNSKPAGNIQKPSRPWPAPPPPKSSNENKPSGPLTRLNELRREHRQLVQETRATSKPKPRIVAKPSVPTPSVPVHVQNVPVRKTKFELLREAKKLEYDQQRQQAMIMKQNKEREKQMKKMEREQERQVAASEVLLVDLPPIPKLITVPVERRGGNFDLIEKVFNSMVMKPNGEFASANAYFRYEDSRCESFRTVGQYAKFWLPMLREEFRASINSSMREEKSHFERHKNPCRLTFVVQEVPELNGIDHFMTLGMEVKEMRAIRTDHGGEEFHAGKVRTNDMVFLEAMNPTKNPSEFVPGRTSVGLVQNVTMERGKILMKACVSFGSPCDTPNQGRRIRVSRLCTSVTFQRQIEAMYSLGKIPDGILWPALEPKQGWEKNIEAVRRIEGSSGDVVKTPFSFVGKLLSDNILNASQGEAIKTVVRGCTPIFKQYGGSKTDTNNSHGGITLIQGPPGTGKTSTIVALLSTLLFANITNTANRAISVEIDGMRHTVNAPPVRILVCAPSNGAVDEIMTRVVSKGLTTREGHQACPKLIRIGVGSTKEELQALELRKMAGIDDLPSIFDEAIAASDAKRQQHLAGARQVNEKISPLDKEQKALRKRLNELADQKGVADEGPRAEECKHAEQRLRAVSESLRNLHRTKQDLHQRLDSERESNKDLEDRRKRDNDLKMAKLLNSCVIVFATLSSSGNDIVQRLGAPFDVTIVDEAAQCVEPDILIPVTAGRRGKSASAFSHLVMVGDPNQLPATVLSENKALSSRMGCSMFQRFSDSAPEQVHMLDTQYRMHPKISLFPNRQFYKGLLLDGASVRQPSMTKAFHEDPKHRFGPLTFIDTKKAGFRETYSSRSGSVGNPEEARAIVCAITALVRLFPSYDFNNEIAILSPYREQVFLIKRQLRRDADIEKLAVEVNTVDGIQGREKSIVFLSTVRGNNARSIGFVRDDRRMNVAITRAKHSVIIFGNGELLGSHSVSWESLVNQCSEQKVRLECPRDDRILFPESQKHVNKNLNPSNKQPTSSSNDKKSRKRQRSEPPRENKNGKRTKKESRGVKEGTNARSEPTCAQKMVVKGLQSDQLRTHNDTGQRSERPRAHNDTGQRSERTRAQDNEKGATSENPRRREDKPVLRPKPSHGREEVRLRSELPRSHRDKIHLRSERPRDSTDRRGLRTEPSREASHINNYGSRSERPRDHNDGKGQRLEPCVHKDEARLKSVPSSGHAGSHSRSEPPYRDEHGRTMRSEPPSRNQHGRRPRPDPSRIYEDGKDYGRGIRSGSPSAHHREVYPKSDLYEDGNRPRSDPCKDGNCPRSDPYKDGNRPRSDPYKDGNHPGSEQVGRYEDCNDKGLVSRCGNSQGRRLEIASGEEGRPNKRPKVDSDPRQAESNESRSSSSIDKGNLASNEMNIIESPVPGMRTSTRPFTSSARPPENRKPTALTQAPAKPRIALRSVPVRNAEPVIGNGDVSVANKADIPVAHGPVVPIVKKAVEQSVASNAAGPVVRKGFMPVASKAPELVARKDMKPVPSKTVDHVANTAVGHVAKGFIPVPAENITTAAKPDGVMSEINKAPGSSAFLPTRSRYGLGERRQKPSEALKSDSSDLTPAPKSSVSMPQREQAFQGTSELRPNSRQRLDFGHETREGPSVTESQPNGISPRRGRRAPRGFQPTCRRGEDRSAKSLLQPPAPLPTKPIVRAPPILRSFPMSNATLPPERQVDRD